MSIESVTGEKKIVQVLHTSPSLAGFAVETRSEEKMTTSLIKKVAKDFWPAVNRGRKIQSKNL